MRLFFCFLVPSALLIAQPIPGRYIVEFQTEPAAAIAAQARRPMAEVGAQMTTRRAQIQAEHAAAEPGIRSLGGAVSMHYDTVFNGVAVNIDDRAAAQLRQLPGVRQVYQDRKHKLNLDHIVAVHHVTDAWQSLPNGMAGAGAGIKIGFLDTGIDINHPGFKGFTTAVPQGFPIVSSATENANTNNKVIVSRDYTKAGGLDQVVGHGTGTSMIAAGVTNDPKLPGILPLTGIAPGAWLGNYRVLDDTGSGSTSQFLAALQDAVKDGMNVINYSAGAPNIFYADETGAEARAIDTATNAGVVVVVAAGNNGPDPGTLGDPGLAPGALSVGSNENERFFDFAVTVPNVPPYQASVPSAEFGSLTVQQITDPVTDVTALDGNGYGCTAFTAGSLTGQIALISRGGPNGNACPFDTKLNNAQKAGADAAIVYDNKAEPGLVNMSLASATLPATFISQASGQDLLSRIAAAPGLTATVDFSGFVPFSSSSDLISDFSASGPTPGAGLKPDLIATGNEVLTAYTTADPTVTIPYQLSGGTSFSAPVVTGAVAVVMGARPGLTAAQYRSLMVNSTTPIANSNGVTVTPQIVGSGKMQLLQALQNNLTAVPSTISYKTSAIGNIDSIKSVVFTNVGTAADTFTVVVNPINTTGPAASVDTATFTLAPGASRTVNVHLAGSALPTGEYDGFITVTGTQTSVATRLPYWFGVTGTAVANIGIEQFDPGPYAVGDTATILIRTSDSIGMPFDAGAPTVTTTGVRSSVTIAPAGDIAGTYQITAHIGRADANGLNVVTVTSGTVSKTLPLVVQ